MQISDKRGRLFNNKSVFLLLAMVSLSLAVYAGSYGNTGGYNPTIGTQIEDTSGEGGEAGEGDASIDDFDHYMNMAFVINCYDGSRAEAHDVGAETGRTVFSDYADYYRREGGALIGGGADVYPPMYPVEYEYLYLGTYTYQDCNLLGCTTRTATGEAPWSDEPRVGYFEQNLSSLTDPKFARFEARGGYKCLLWTRIDHTKFKAGEYPTKDAEWWNNTAVDEYVDEISYQVDWDRNRSQCELIGGAWNDDSSFEGYQCCGDDYIWVNNVPINYSLSFSDEELETRKSMDNLCLYSNTQADVPYGNCWSREPENWGLQDNPPLFIACNEDNIQNGYACDVPNGDPYYNLPYDEKLDLDNPENPDEAESMVADSEAEFFFFGHPRYKVPVLETDIGKWSDQDGANPLVCVHEFDNTEGAGDTFRWMQPQDAADLNPFYCEVVLGYGWTGERCCHNLSGYITYNDEERDLALSTNIGEQFLSELGNYVQNYPTLFEHVFQNKYDQYKDLSLTEDNVADNKACWEGSAVLHNRAFASDPSDPGTMDVLNYDGVFYGCADIDGQTVIDNSLPGLEQSEDQPKCTILGTHVCAYYNDSWVELKLGSVEVPTIAESKLGYVAGKNTAYPSFAPNNTEVVECCLSGTCWDGGWLEEGKCVGEDQPYQMLRNPDGTPNPSTWKPFDNQNDIDSKIIYKCDKGKWVETEPKFNWWDDTRDVKYCASNNSCACSTDEESSYYCMHYSCDETAYDSRVNCVPKYHDEGCTNKTNYFTEDHYCEAQYAGDGSGTVVSAEWTSRTKLLAAYFWKIAQEKNPDQYVIFCDYISSSVNDLTSYADDMNLFSNPYCVLNVSGQVYVGTSISGKDMLLEEAEQKYDDPMKIEDEVNRFTSNGIGIIDILLGGQGHLTLYDCADAETVDRLHGEFQRCEDDNNTVYFNNKTLQIFYTREGIDTVPTMTEADYINFNDFLKEKKQKVQGYIQSRGTSTFSRSLHIDLVNYVSTYDRLYINKNSDKVILGTMDEEFLSERVVPEYKKNLRNVSFVVYEGLDIDCDEVAEASLDDSLLVCGEHEDAVIVIETGVLATDDYGKINGLYHWNDLTSKVRLSGSG